MRAKPTNDPGPSDPAGLDGDRLEALGRGKAHYARREWAEAHKAFAVADAAGTLVGGDLELHALSAGLAGDDEAMLSGLERAYHAFVDAGECEHAARTAFWLGFRLGALGEFGRAGGWLARSQRLVEREPKPSVVEGYLLLPVVRRHFAAGENEDALRVARRAAEIGDRFDDADLCAFARNLQGRILVQQGQIAEALPLLDEAMLAATSGELSPIITGLVYCSAIDCCKRIYALDRAREWTSALARWCDVQPQLVRFSGSCLVHRAELMQIGGAWSQASEEAKRAAERFTGGLDPEATGDAYYQQGEICRLRGEFVAAEEAYRSASEFGREPQPGLALLRLSQGRSDAAVSAIRRVLGATKSTYARVRLLPAYVEILLAAGDTADARGACRELDEAAVFFGTDVLGAIASGVRGLVRLAEGDAQGAIVPLRSALKTWQQVGAPYHVARTRLTLARACRAVGDDDGAALELRRAREAFDQLGAAPDLAIVDAFTNDPTTEKPATAAASSHGLTARELQVLRLVAAGKTNKVIAAELFLSEKTVDRHMSNIFGKVNVSSRAGATAFAYENGLI